MMPYCPLPLQRAVLPRSPDREGHPSRRTAVDRGAHDVQEERTAVGTEARARELVVVREVLREVEDPPVAGEPPDVLLPRPVLADDDSPARAHRDVVRAVEHLRRRRLEDERQLAAVRPRRPVLPHLAAPRVAAVGGVEEDAAVTVPAPLEPRKARAAAVVPLREDEIGRASCRERV